MKSTEEIIEKMTLSELCGQLICYDLSSKRWNEEELHKIAEETKPGGIFVYSSSKEIIDKYSKIINEHTNIPIIVSSDAEHGLGGPVKGLPTLPLPMAWGACDDEKLIKKAGKATAEICRANGIHWSFAPIADVILNKDSLINVRAISDSPKQVVKIAGAYMDGMQKDGLMAAGCKHFPGEGIDDRNSHFCTTICPLSKEKWLETYGYIYKEMIKKGAYSIMVGHEALPAFQENEYDEILGYKPATLSYSLMTKLLKEELGFEGCVVSDAMSMVGACSMVDPDKLAVEFIKAGGDMVLFALPNDFKEIKNAVLNGEISIERIKDAVRRIINLKKAVGLLCNEPKSIEIKEDIYEIAKEIADKSINIVRNTEHIIPLNIKKGGKILICNLLTEFNRVTAYSLDTITQELENRGYEVLVLTNPGHRTVEEKLKENPDCVLVNCRISCRDYYGGSLRVDWEHIAAFWRGNILKHPKLVFTSFGDPYKLYEFPYLKTYINTFSNVPETQKAFVRVLLGEVKATGKSPVSLKGFFKRETD